MSGGQSVSARNSSAFRIDFWRVEPPSTKERFTVRRSGFSASSAKSAFCASPEPPQGTVITTYFTESVLRKIFAHSERTVPFFKGRYSFLTVPPIRVDEPAAAIITAVVFPPQTVSEVIAVVKIISAVIS